MFTSVGIGMAILVHVAYSLVGISVLLKTTPWLYTAFTYIAAAYLLYLASGALRSGPAQTNNEAGAEIAAKQPAISAKKAFIQGFLTNGLNPKATLFFLSLFTVIIDSQTPSDIRLIYGLYLSFATGAWFCLLSYLLSTSRVAGAIRSKGYWLDRAMGVLLIGLAVKLVLA